MMHMELRHLEIVKRVLSKYPYSFYAFGSRSTGNPRLFSDLDLCFFEDIPWNVRAHIDEDFDESDLPYTVDVIDWNLCNQQFQNRIKKDFLLIQKGKKTSNEFPI